MSLSGSLSNALSGLTAASRRTEAISSNLANAMTEGYGRRDIILRSNATSSSGGVKLSGISRAQDLRLAAQTRHLTAEAGDAAVVSKAASRLERAFGGPDSPGSLPDRVQAFSSALIAASSTPQSKNSLDATVNSAKALIVEIKAISDEIQAVRETADQNIASDIEKLSSGLARLHKLNKRIVSEKSQDRDVSALRDLREKELSDIAPLLSFTRSERDDGSISLISEGGLFLLNQNPAQISFAISRHIDPSMTVTNGALSGLSVDGRPIETSLNGPLGGGRIMANFRVRDEMAVRAQSDIDAIARSLVERFQAIENSVPSPAPLSGLFTDQGQSYTALSDERGLSRRLALNSSVDDSRGGNSVGLRNGLHASVPVPVGDNTKLIAMVDALQQRLNPTAGPLANGKLSFPKQVGAIVEQNALGAARAEQTLSFASAQLKGLQSETASRGIDSDFELHQMLETERFYSANAKMLSVVDELLGQLLRI